ncbi:MAG: DoxX family protein [Chloroflexi bacterium]|nr:DoxX family protein [Chloroflexota bacterium]
MHVAVRGTARSDRGRAPPLGYVRACEGRCGIVNRTLWSLQVVLGLFFVLASGLPKLIVPLLGMADDLPMPIPLPLWFLTFTGVCEVLGGLGLILPGIVRIRPGLMPLSATGLALVAVGGTVYQLAAGEPGNAVFAVVIALLCVFVGYGRWQIVPLRTVARRRTERELAA